MQILMQLTAQVSVSSGGSGGHQETQDEWFFFKVREAIFNPFWW